MISSIYIINLLFLKAVKIISLVGNIDRYDHVARINITKCTFIIKHTNNPLNDVNVGEAKYISKFTNEPLHSHLSYYLKIQYHINITILYF